MSLPRANYDPRRVCLNPFPEIHLGKHKRTAGIYIAGALFALANWTFLDAAILSKHAKDPFNDPSGHPHVTFLDWVPGICSLLGYLVINLIDKDRVKGEDGFGDANAVWRARLLLFIGFAFIAGGMAGSITILILKYALHNYAPVFMFYGYANVSQNIVLALSAVILWISQNSPDEYQYRLSLICASGSTDYENALVLSWFIGISTAPNNTSSILIIGVLLLSAAQINTPSEMNYPLGGQGLRTVGTTCSAGSSIAVDY